MLFNSVTASIFLLALTSSVNAQATGSPQSGSVFAPALGNPNPGLSDVQHPSDTTPCGDKPIGSNLDTSTPIAVGSNGQFSIQVTSFGAGANNSRSIQTAKVDPKGTGESFSECKIVTNGDQVPSAAGTQEVTLQLPDNTKCGGGTDGKRCLISIVTDAGDGNCLVLTQAETTTQSSTATTGGKAQPDGQNGDQTKINNTGSDNSKNQKRMSRKRRL